MADVITNVKTADIQIVDEYRNDTTTVKLDNPKENLTKAEVSTAFAPAFTNEWLLTNKSGRPAKYLGDVTINTSTKIKLGGSDYYVTPNALVFGSGTSSQTVTVSGAYIQGYNVIKKADNVAGIEVALSENGLTATVVLSGKGGDKVSADLILVIQGVEVTVPMSGTV